MKALNVLLVDCGVDDAEMLKTELKKGGYKLKTQVSSCFQVQAACRYDWDIVFCGLSSKNISAVSNLVKEQNGASPIILLTDKKLEDAALKLMETGARDYVLKDNLKRLVPLVGREIGKISSLKTKNYARNIDGEKQTLEKIQCYDVIFNQLRDAAILLKSDGTIVDVNPAAVEVYGYTREEFLKLTIFDLCPGEYKDKIMKKMVQADRSGIRLETWYRRKDGKEIYVDVSCKGINYNNQRLLLNIIRDISERKSFEQALRQIINDLEKTVQGTVQALATLTEYRDSYTAGHQQRVANLAVSIAEEIGLPQDKIEALYIAGILHDIGKIILPTEILSKPARLSPLETELVKTHCAKGYEIIKNIPFKQDIASITLQHHERMDGSGYPQGLKGEHILPEARILAVADVVEAMSTHRPYRPALGLHQAIAELMQNKGILYDPKVVEACLKIYGTQKLEAIINI